MLISDVLHIKGRNVVKVRPDRQLWHSLWQGSPNIASAQLSSRISG